jgi:solute carrier family 25 folate transporter 32
LTLLTLILSGVQQGQTMPYQSLSPLIAGFTGGVVSTTLLLPLDVIKVRLQVNESPASPVGSDQKHGRKRRLGATRVMQGIVKHEGFRGLWVGWTPAVIGSAVSWGGYFFFYESFKKQLVEHKNRQTSSGGASNSATTQSASDVLSSLDNFALACTAGGVMVLMTNPIWLIKIRMQLQMKRASELLNIKPYRNIGDAVATIVREEGPLALYKGVGPALLLTSHGGVQFVVYEYLKKHFHFQRINREDTGRASQGLTKRLQKSAGYLAMGAVAKIAASTVTYPLQTIKARMQQRSDALEFTADGEVRAVRRDYRGLFSTIKRVFRQEGFVGFFKGCIPNAIRVAPGAAITFVVYEALMDYLD